MKAKKTADNVSLADEILIDFNMYMVIHSKVSNLQREPDLYGYKFKNTNGFKLKSTKINPWAQ